MKNSQDDVKNKNLIQNSKNTDNNTISDIEKARLRVKQQAIKNKKKKILCSIIVIIGIFLVINIINPLSFGRTIFNKVQNVFNKNDFPIVVDYGVEKFISNMGNDAFIVTDTGQFFLNKNGNVFNKNTHNFSDVDYDVNGNNFVLFEYNSPNFIKGSKNSKSKNVNFSQKILDATISKDGKVALILPSSNYLNEVVVLNENNEEIFRWFSAKEYVSNIKFNNTGTQIYVNTVSTKNGIINSTIYTLDFDDTKEKHKVQMENTTVVDFFYDDNAFTILSSDRVFSIDLNSKITKNYSYTNKSLVAYGFVDNNVVLILSGDKNSNTFVVKVLDTILKEHASFDYYKSIKDVFIDDTGIYITSNNIINWFSLNGKLKKEFVLDFYFSDFVRVGDDLIFLGNSQIEKIKIN